jgi:hypothetical protein
MIDFNKAWRCWTTANTKTRGNQRFSFKRQFCLSLFDQ